MFLSHSFLKFRPGPVLEELDHSAIKKTTRPQNSASIYTAIKRWCLHQAVGNSEFFHLCWATDTFRGEIEFLLFLMQRASFQHLHQKIMYQKAIWEQRLGLLNENYSLWLLYTVQHFLPEPYRLYSFVKSS